MKHDPTRIINRREFLKTSSAALMCWPVLKHSWAGEETAMEKSRVALVKTRDRKQGVKEVMRLFDHSSIRGKRVLIKPNFNSADPTPGSTHVDTLAQLIDEIHKAEASQITIGERSGPPPTKKVLEDKGIFELVKEHEAHIINFEELPEESGWVHFNPPGNHWAEGFYVARPVVESEYLISTCCLKTHQYGGVFTMSLKLSVGVTPKSLMRQLHSSPDQRKMIAEINLGYKPQLIVMDGVEAFVDGGPSTGKKVEADVFVGGTDRVAVDAVGVAILKDLGSNAAIMRTKIFEQEQIKRAAELGIGISSPKQIEFVSPDEPSRAYADKLKGILIQG